MSQINYLAVVVAAVAAFVVSSVWYIVFGAERMKQLRLDANTKAEMEKAPAWKMLGEFVRSLFVTWVLAYFVVEIGIDNWKGALQLGFFAWIGFPVMILLGSVMWENVPLKLAAIHAGDWFVKLLVVAVILGVWR